MGHHNYWKKLSRKQQNQLLLLLVAALLGGYGFYYSLLNKQIGFIENMIGRAENRIQVKYGKLSEVKANPRALQSSLERLESSLQANQTRIQMLEARFAPPHSLAAMQEIRLEISRLAEQSGLVIKRMEGGGRARMGEKREVAPGKDFVELQLNNRYRRPLVNMVALAEFPGLLSFLDGLKTLRHTVSPVGVEVKARVPETLKSEVAVELRQQLEVRLLLAL